MPAKAAYIVYAFSLWLCKKRRESVALQKILATNT